MTTIAANRDCMASDSKIVAGEGSFYAGTKMYVYGDRIVGVAGEGRALVDFLHWCEEGFPPVTPEKSKGSFDALVLSAHGLYHYNGDYWPEEMRDGFHAIGTGGMVARAMMIRGMSPDEAVEVAITVDNNSGFPVVVRDVASLPKRKNKR